MKRLGTKVIGLGDKKGGGGGELDQKWVWAIKRSIVGVTETTAITKKTCYKKAYIVAVRYSAAIIKRNAVKTHILWLFFFFFFHTTAIKRLK